MGAQEPAGSRNRTTAYRRWMEEQGIPVHGGYGVTDIRALARRPWRRLGGPAAFIDLHGMEGYTGLYLGEIPPGASLAPQQHLYEEIVYVVEGRGATEVWEPGDGGRRLALFEWAAGSLFAVPLNFRVQLHNAGREPVLFLAASNLPLVMDLYRSEAFVFGTDFRFSERLAGDADWFVESGARRPMDVAMVWETNFVSDVRSAFLDAKEARGAGARVNDLEMCGNALITHIAEYPVGRYSRFHHHGGGAILLTIRSRGYTLMWPSALGPRPYAGGHGGATVRVDWSEGSVYSPPTGWYHAHFNTGSEPVRQLAFRFGSRLNPTGFHMAATAGGLYVSQAAGGNLIHYHDEDPQIRQDYEGELRAAGLASAMPAALYRAPEPGSAAG